MGYANPILHIPFDEFAEPGDPIWVAIRNPKLQPPDTMRPRDVPLGPDGKPVHPEDAVEAMYEIIADLVVAWRVYDVDVDVTVADDGSPIVGEAKLLPPVTLQNPATKEQVKRLPMGIVTALAERLKVSANPQ